MGANMKPTSICLADDHVVVRQGIKALLEKQKWLQVTAQASTGREIIKIVADAPPDLIIMDIAMPDMNGIEATRRISELCPQTRIIILSVYSSAEHIHQAVAAGAGAYILKESAGEELLDAIRVVQCNRLYLSSKIENDMPSIRENLGKKRSPLERLSPREREILQFVVEGKTSSEIAEILLLSSKTVDTYRFRLMQKLQVPDLAALIKFAIANGITTL